MKFVKIIYVFFLFGFSWAQQWPNGFASFRPRPLGGGVGTVSAGIAFPNLVAGPQRLEPKKKLGEDCATDLECQTAFAGCAEKKCQCLPGFEVISQKCQPKSFTCPFGEPLKDGNSVKQCERTQKWQLAQGSQPLGIAPQPVPLQRALGSQPLGIAPQPVPLQRATRQAVAVAPAFSMMPFRTFDFVDSCPENSYCLLHEQQYVNGTGHCCPKPKIGCPVGEPHPTAKCVPQIGGIPPQPGVGQICDFNTHFCYLLQTGIGAAMEGAICCPRPCPLNTIHKNDRCYGMSRIGDSCEIDDQCKLVQGFCADGKCKCSKGFLDRNGFCIQPRCGFAHLIPFFMPVAGGAPASSGSPVTDENGEIKRCDSNNDCGDGYCEQSQNICCQKPDPYCPGGSKAPEKPKPCNVAKENACGENEYCFQYFNAAVSFGNSSDPMANSICCQQAVPFPILGGPIG